MGCKHGATVSLSEGGEHAGCMRRVAVCVPSFHVCVCVWAAAGIGEGAERELLTDFGHVIRVFQSLPAPQQEVIADITARMGTGMALYCSRDLKQGTTDVEDYNTYCHFVAGLVGEGLSKLFAASGFEGALSPCACVCLCCVYG